MSTAALTPSGLGIAGSAAAVAGVAVAGFGIVGGSPWTIGSGVAFVQIGILLLVVGSERTETPLAHPLFLWTIPLLFGAALRPWWFLSQSSTVRSSFLASAPESVIVEGTLASGLFFVAALTGYAIVQRHARVSTRVAGSPLPLVGIQVMTVAALGLAVVGFIGFVNAHGISLDDLADQASTKRRTFIDGQKNSFAYWAWMIDAGALGAALIFFERDRIRTRWVVPACLGLLTLQATHAIISSVRSRLLLMALVIIAIWSGFGHRLTLRGILSGGAIALVVLSALGSLRASQSNDVSLDDVGSLSAVTESALATHNWAGVEKTGVIIHRVPERWEYQYGATLSSALVAPIPRPLWPDKPAVRIGPQLGDRIFDLDRDLRSGLPPGLPGEMYMNFGWLGIPIGGVVFGAVLMLVHQRFLSSAPDDRTRVIWFVLLLELGIRFPGGDLAGQFTVVLMRALFLITLGYLCSGKYLPRGNKAGQLRLRPLSR